VFDLYQVRFTEPVVIRMEICGPFEVYLRTFLGKCMVALSSFKGDLCMSAGKQQFQMP
jgi:hypothetical protein